MTAAVRLAMEVRRRFSRPATPAERACYDLPPVRLPLVPVVINERVVILEADPADREELEAMGVQVYMGGAR